MREGEKEKPKENNEMPSCDEGSYSVGVNRLAECQVDYNLGKEVDEYQTTDLLEGEIEAFHEDYEQ